MAPDDHEPDVPGREAESAAGGTAPQEMDRLRTLLFGPEQRRLAELSELVGSGQLGVDELARILPEAVAQRAGEDEDLATALAPTIESGISDSVHRNPEAIAEAIYPTLGPAIRKAIAETMSSLVETVNTAVEHSFSWRGVKWRFEAWRTGVPFGEVVIRHSLVYQIEQAFLIHGETGLLLAHTALADSQASDPDLVSGMLTAIRDFVHDSFEVSGAGGLRRFSVGDRTVMVEAGPQALLAVAIRGQPPETVAPCVRQTLEGIHLNYRKPLREFDGDSTALEPAVADMRQLLETVLDTERSGARSLAPRIAWALVGLLLLVGGVLWVRSILLYRDALGTLKNQPGIVVVDAQRGWRRWSFSGLRDPLAADPEAVLAAVGVGTDGVDADWRPYVSLEPSILLQRVRQRLVPPGAVEIDLQGSELRVNGLAPMPWIDGARNARLIEGIDSVDLSGLQPMVPEAMVALKERIEGRRVLFDSGSERIRSTISPIVSLVRDDLDRLAALATAGGWSVTLELVGRTDEMGTSGANISLSERRARVVMERLGALGWALDQTSSRGIGDSEPLTAPAGAEPGALNRSVSFILTLAAEEAEP